MKTHRRILLLDELRGLSILLMVLYHGTYSFLLITGIQFPFFESFLMTVLQSFFSGLFILISGICVPYSRNPLRRGVIYLGTGLLITLVTALFVPDMAIWFGILHFLGIAMILYSLVKQLLHSINPRMLIIILLLLFCLTFQIYDGVISILYQPLFFLPYELYTTSFLFPLGFPSLGFSSGDYFPLLPWIFLFFSGAVLGKSYFQAEHAPNCFYTPHSKFLTAVSRYSLPIYLLHQPLLFGLFTLFDQFFG